MSAPVLHLETLRLVGLDVEVTLGGTFRPLTDLPTLTSLTIESCCRLSNAFSTWTPNSGDGNVSRLPNLQSFSVRQEKISPDFLDDLVAFICHLSPLTALRVLLEGNFDEYLFTEILKTHGATLRALVWDERLYRRKKLVDDGLWDMSDAGKLCEIAEFCPNLVELGISVRWDEGPAVPGETGHRAHVSISREDMTTHYMTLMLNIILSRSQKISRACGI